MPPLDLQRSSVLVVKHLDTLFRVAYRLTQNVPDAQDLVQDTCVAAAENLSRLSALARNDTVAPATIAAIAARHDLALLPAAGQAQAGASFALNAPRPGTRSLR